MDRQHILQSERDPFLQILPLRRVRGRQTLLAPVSVSGHTDFVSKISQEHIAELTVSERIQLAEDLWDSIAADPDSLPLTNGQREELDRRLEAHRRDPSTATAWSEVRSRLER